MAQATNVSLSDLLPAGMTATVNNGTVTQGSYNAATGLWTIGTLANGAVATLTLEGTVDAGQGGNTITNTTTAAEGDQPDPSTAGDDLEEDVTVGGTRGSCHRQDAGEWRHHAFRRRHRHVPNLRSPTMEWPRPPTFR